MKNQQKCIISVFVVVFVGVFLNSTDGFVILQCLTSQISSKMYYIITYNCYFYVVCKWEENH